MNTIRAFFAAIRHLTYKSIADYKEIKYISDELDKGDKS